MSGLSGKFVWCELIATNAPAAEAFYTSVVGWGSRDAGGAAPYTVFTQGEARAAGMITLPHEELPFWMGYIAVDDVDAYAARFSAAGGTVHKAPWDIPGTGRLAVVGDAQGAPLTLFRAEPGTQPEAAHNDQPGGVHWRDLMAEDGPAAFEFYADMFGWTEDRTYDLGDMGVYQLFAAADGEVIGGMMTKPQAVPSAFWSFYFMVDSVKAAAGRIEAGGGKVINGPVQVPTGSWVIQAMDPQAAFFSLVSLQA
jgi:predicted enzyme related to lactoylglutathione lyase